jgi:23S rRNA G2445 N2-methylase RlmL
VLDCFCGSGTIILEAAELHPGTLKGRGTDNKEHA